MIPVTMLYGTPDDAAAQIAYIEKRGYPISYIEMEKNQTANTPCLKITPRFTSNGPTPSTKSIQN